MANRLDQIYTRTGDKGSTALGDGRRVGKDDLRIEALGTLDELNAVLGIVLSHELPDEARDILVGVQHDLFDLGGAPSMPGYERVGASYIKRLERELDALNAQLPPLKEFILRGGAPAAAHCHHACTVCRRAERVMVRLASEQNINPQACSYLNRLSDLLFVLPRVLNKHAGVADVHWQPGRHSHEDAA